jgi:sugar lactone lactonase YvrE
MKRTLAILSVCGLALLVRLAFPAITGSGGRISQLKTDPVWLEDATGVAAGPDGSVYITDAAANRIFRVTRGGVGSLVAGTGDRGFSPDGTPATSARLEQPAGILVDPQGGIYFTEETELGRVRQITSDGRLETIAGSSRPTSSNPVDGLPATQEPLSLPSSLTRDVSGNLYVATFYGVLRIGPDGRAKLVAGRRENQRNYTPAQDGDLAVGAYMVPQAIAVDVAGNLYVADRVAFRILRVDPQGRLRTIASSGPSGSITPESLAVDRGGVLYLSQGHGLPVLRISPSGHVMAITAGGDVSFVRAGSSATATRIDAEGLALDGAGNLYVAAGQAVYRLAAPLPTPLFGDADPGVAALVTFIAGLLVTWSLILAGRWRATRYSGRPPVAAGGRLA